MAQRRQSSKRNFMESVEKICHRLASQELDSSGTSCNSSTSKESLRSIREHKNWDERDGMEGNSCPDTDNETSPETESRSRSSYSSATESCSLSGEDRSRGRGGKTTEEQES